MDAMLDFREEKFLVAPDRPAAANLTPVGKRNGEL
jgi:hypothetical protein